MISSVDVRLNSGQYRMLTEFNLSGFNAPQLAVRIMQVRIHSNKKGAISFEAFCANELFGISLCLTLPGQA
jgi:hypothetical protein